MYVAGQVSRDEQGQIVARGDFRGQAHQVFANLQKALAAAGGSLKDLAKITVYVTDPRYRDPLREVQARVFGRRAARQHAARGGRPGRSRLPDRDRRGGRAQHLIP